MRLTRRAPSASPWEARRLATTAQMMPTTPAGVKKKMVQATAHHR